MERIVVGVDTSAGARRALQWAVDEARVRGAVLEAVHVWHLPALIATPFGPLPVETGNDMEAAALQHFDELLDAVPTAGLAAPIVRTFVAGHPASALVEVAREADLLVVGTRGHGGFAGLLLGSVSQQVVHHAPCPVVIVPSEDRH